jgi:imidazolonepropionase-like amidohydrolase
MADVSRATASASIPTFSRPELQVILQTAAQYGTKVAAHSTERPSVSSLLALGVHSIEHAPWESLVAGLEGVKITDASSSTHWVPTLSVMYTTREVDGGKRWAQISKSFQQALAAGFDRIACGGDTGPFPHGENALEMRLMVKLGADWRRVIQWGTLGGWKCVRSMRWEGKEGSDRLTRAEALVDGGEDIRVVGDNEVPFGAIRRGWAADIVAIDGDLEKDFDNAVGVDSVKFVMKGGRIFKSGGVEIPWM